jgi:acetyl esterase/lipase
MANALARQRHELLTQSAFNSGAERTDGATRRIPPAAGLRGVAAYRWRCVDNVSNDPDGASPMSPRADQLLPAMMLSTMLALAWPGLLAAPLAGDAAARHEPRAESADSTEMETDSTTLVGRRSAVALPADVEVRQDLVYGPEPRHRLDVYIPRGAQSAPIVFMVHGGGWMFGDKRAGNVVNAKVARWAPRGYILVSPNYRLSRSPKVMEQAEDVGRALAFTQANAASWGGDPARVALMGHSAGAHLVALLTAAPQIATAQGAKPWIGTVALDSAALDVVDVMENKHPRFYDRVFGSDRSFWESVSPFHRLSGAPVAPILLVCSSRRADSCPRSKAFAAKAEAAGGRATVLAVDLSHGEVNATLGLDSDYTRSVDAFMRSLRLP